MTQNSRGRSFVPTRVAGRAVAAGLSAGLVASVVAFAGPAFAAGGTTVNNIAASNNVETARLGGADRYATSIAFSTAVWTKDNLPSSVVLAAGDVLGPDALAAAALAGAENGPVLLTAGQAVPTSVVAELVRLKTLKPSLTVYIVGGEGVVSKNVESFLTTLFQGDKQVVRLGGQNRYETAELVSAKVVADAAPATAILANGEGLADALSAGPLSNAKRFPIVLTTAGSLPDAAKKALEGFSNVLVVGGKGVVSDAVVAQAEAVVGSGNVTRIAAGTNRFDTAAQLAKYEGDTVSVGFGYNDLVLARGEGLGPNFADALSAGAYAGTVGAPILLTAGPAPTNIPTETAAFHVAHKDTIVKITAAGGTASITDAALGAAAAAAGDKHAPLFYGAMNASTEAVPHAFGSDTSLTNSNDENVTASVDKQATGSLGANSTLLSFTVKSDAVAKNSDGTTALKLEGVNSNGVRVVVKTGTPAVITSPAANTEVGYSEPAASVSTASPLKAVAVTNTVTKTVTVTVTSDAKVSDVVAALTGTDGTNTTGTASSLVAVKSLDANGDVATGSITLSGGTSTVQVRGYFDDALLASAPGTSNFGLDTDSSNAKIEIPAATKVTAEDDGGYTVTFNLTGDQRTNYASGARLYVSGVADLAGNQTDIYTDSVVS